MSAFTAAEMAARAEAAFAAAMAAAERAAAARAMETRAEASGWVAAAMDIDMAAAR